MTGKSVKALARRLGFELVGVAAAEPTLESLFYPDWLARGYAGEMNYLAGRRGELRSDPKKLLPSAKSLICLGLVYNSEAPYSTEEKTGATDAAGWVSRYAWGADYHTVLKDKLFELVEALRREAGDFDYKVCVDTAPLLERTYAHHAGLGWIGKNTCLINQQLGSWVFLGEIITSLDLEPDQPAPFRCGTCTRCIDACPTDALVPIGDPAGPADGPSHALDSRLCISYWTIELRGSIPEQHRGEMGAHIFGCDICQDVCPWNRSAATTAMPEFQPKNRLPPLDELASMTREEFDARFSASPIERTRYRGFLRNVAAAMGNSGKAEFREPLRRMCQSDDPVIREHAQWALNQLDPLDQLDGEGEPAA